MHEKCVKHFVIVLEPNCFTDFSWIFPHSLLFNLFKILICRSWMLQIWFIDSTATWPDEEADQRCPFTKVLIHECASYTVKPSNEEILYMFYCLQISKTRQKKTCLWMIVIFDHFCNSFQYYITHSTQSLGWFFGKWQLNAKLQLPCFRNFVFKTQDTHCDSRWCKSKASKSFLLLLV